MPIKRKSLNFIENKRNNSKFTIPQQQEVLKAAHAFNQRITQLKNDTGLDFQRVSLAKLRDDLKAGLDKEGFMQKYGQIITGYYVNKGSVQGIKDVVKDEEFIFRKTLGRNRYDLEGKEVFSRLVKVVNDINDNNLSGGIPREIISNVSVQGILNKNNYNPYEVEKDVVLLEEIVKGTDLREFIKEGKARKKEHREEELVDLTRKLLKSHGYTDEQLKDIGDMPFERLLRVYTAQVGDLYKTDGEYRSPGYFNVKDRPEKEEVRNFVNNSLNFRDSILMEYTNTNYYLDNYFRALENQEDIKDARSIMELLQAVDRNKLKNFLLQENLKLDMWYRDEDSGHDKSREHQIVSKIQELYESDYDRKKWFNFKTDKAQKSFEDKLSKLVEKVNK